jgi:hypothetical protein
MLHQLTRNSTLVFQGTVTDATVVDGTIAVRVDRILRSTPFFAGFTGSEIRVLVGREAPDKGQQALFFTRGSRMGKDVIVEELARFIDSDEASMSALLDRTAGEIADEVLVDRLRAVDLVVIGRVSGGRHLKQRFPRITEHDPQWQEAIVVVRETLKGPAQRRISVLFPGSNDVMWRGTPRLRPQQEGIFLLTSAAAMKIDLPAAFTALDPLDVQPLSALDRIRNLVLRLR